MFSVLIPVYNHAGFLRQAVESAIRDPLVGEVLVVDDGSGDDSPRVIADLSRLYGPKLRDIGVSRCGNRGAHVRLNELVTAARHEWVAVLNSDDVFVPSRFAVARPLCRNNRTEFVSGHLLIVDELGKTVGRKRGWLDPEYDFPDGLCPNHTEAGDWRQADWQETFRARLLNQNFIATTSNMLFTRRLHSSLGGFRDYRYCHDWDFALRAAFAGNVGWCDHALTCYRLHGSNTIAESRDAIVADVRRMFQRLQADIGDLGTSRRVHRGLSENRYLAAA